MDRRRSDLRARRRPPNRPTSRPTRPATFSRSGRAAGSGWSPKSPPGPPAPVGRRPNRSPPPGWKPTRPGSPSTRPATRSRPGTASTARSARSKGRTASPVAPGPRRCGSRRSGPKPKPRRSRWRPSGAAEVTWSGWNEATLNYQLRAIRLSQGGAWQQPSVLVSGELEEAYGPHVAIDQSGDAIVVWNGEVGLGAEIMSSFREGTSLLAVSKTGTARARCPAGPPGSTAAPSARPGSWRKAP